jgi:chromosome segregation ATPase
MRTSKCVTMSLIVALAAAVTMGQDQPAARSPNAEGGSPKGQSRGDAEAVNLVGQRSELTRKVQVLELDLAGIDAQRKALQEQIAVIREEAGKRSGEDVVTQELQRLVEISERRLSQVQQSVAAGRATLVEVTQAQESVAKARIELARRREELSKQAGGGQSEEFTKEVSRLAIDKAEKEAQLQIVRRQLDQVQQRLTQVAPLATGTDADAVNLGGQRSELTRRVQGLELDLAGIDARRKALQEQIPMIREETGKRLGEDAVTQELQRLVGISERCLSLLQQSAAAGRVSVTELAEGEKNLAQAKIDLARRREELSKQAGGGPLAEFTKELGRLAIDKAGKEAQLQTVRRQLEDVLKQLAQVAPLAPRTDADAVNLGGQQNELTRRAQALELDLAGIDARRKALQEQIAMIREEANKRLSEDVVTQELQKLVGTSERNLSQLQQSAAAGRVSAAELAEAEKNLAQARIDLARRREELGKQAGSGQLEEFNKELSRLAIDKAEKEAQLQIVRRQLDEVQKQLAEALGV